MTICIVCGRESDRPIRDALGHFRLVDWGKWQYWPGNIRTFGFWGGLRGSLTLSFPFINTLWNWKNRKSELVIRE